jgi:phosphoribosylanthranilate isomerase
VIAVKICGINTPDAFDAAVEAGADWIGFVFFAASPRHVTPVQARDLSARSPGGPARVGLFVDPSEDEIARTLDLLQLDALQLYAPAARVAALGTHVDCPVWHALPVASRADLPTVAAGIGRLVLEARPPSGATRPGGNATALDWSLLRGWAAPCPWLLAGGLTPDNVVEAIRITAAPAVDVSSGVETHPGVKDPALIRKFMAAARAA